MPKVTQPSVRDILLKAPGVPFPPQVTGGWCRSQALSKQHPRVLLRGPPFAHCSAWLTLIHPSVPRSGSPSFRSLPWLRMSSHCSRGLPAYTPRFGLDRQPGLPPTTTLITLERSYWSAFLSDPGQLQGRNHVFSLCSSSACRNGCWGP